MKRLDDIPELVEYFTARHSEAMGKRVTGASSETIRTLMAAHWKGNVRQMDNAVERAVMMCDGEEILPADLPPDLLGLGTSLPDTDDLRSALRHYEQTAHHSGAEAVPGQKRSGEASEAWSV